MIRKILLTVTLIISGVSFNSTISKAGPSGNDEKPNVIIVITDDQGYGDLGCTGNSVIQTPSIDQFYNDAVRFTDFHVSPTCAPTRAALMTGRYTNRLNCFHTLGGRSQLFRDEVVMAEIFAKNGYKTAMFGKWHLGDNYPFRPEDRGFQETVWHRGGGLWQIADYWGNDYFDDTFLHNGEYQKYEGYCTDVFFENALDFIEEHKNEPFFVYLSTNAPHLPLFLPEKYYDIYKDESTITEDQKRFYGMITNIDDNFRLLEDKLEDLGLKENTIVIFMTDNGTATGYETQNSKHFGFNAGMKGTKNSEYEGGHRVPFFIRWPGADIHGGKDIEKLSAHIDVLPTLVDLCGLRFSPQKPLDGRSLKPLLRGEGQAWPSRTLIVDSQRELNLVKWRKSSVMDDQWRLVNGKELYNIKQDPGQNHDLASEYPEVVSRLRESYDKWWQSLMDAGVNELYAYIEAGTPYENPVRITSEDLITGFWGNIWQQNHALQTKPADGIYKVHFTQEGNYRISLCRYPRESGLTINENFPGIKPTDEVHEPLPQSNDRKMTRAVLYVADHERITKPIKPGDKEVNFDVYMQEGKFDLDARMMDELERVYPVYYLYIEKL